MTSDYEILEDVPFGIFAVVVGVFCLQVSGFFEFTGIDSLVMMLWIPLSNFLQTYEFAILGFIGSVIGILLTAIGLIVIFGVEWMTDSDNQDQDVLLMDEAQVMLRHLEDLTYSNHPDYPSPEQVEELRDDIKNRIREINRSVGGDSSTTQSENGKACKKSTSSSTSPSGVEPLMPDPDAWMHIDDVGEKVFTSEKKSEDYFPYLTEQKPVFAVETIQAELNQMEGFAKVEYGKDNEFGQGYLKAVKELREVFGDVWL